MTPSWRPLARVPRALALGAVLLGVLIADPTPAAEGDRPADWRGSWFGHRVLGLPDIDGDGAADLVVAAPGHVVRGDGSVLALSSKSGKSIWIARGGIPGEWGLGWSLCLLRDVDGDSIPDVAARCSLQRRETGTEHEVRVLSGRSGHTIRRLRAGSPEWSTSFGDRIAAVGDVDGDGTEDLAINDEFAREDGLPIAGVVVYSGKTAAILRRIDGGQRTGGIHAVALCKAGDWDGRGRPDIAIAVPTEDHETNRILVVAGEDGAIVRSIEADGRHRGFGNSLLPVPDEARTPRPTILALTRSYEDGSGQDPSVLFRLSPPPTEPVLVGRVPVSPQNLNVDPIGIRGKAGFSALVVAGADLDLEQPETRVYALGVEDARPLWFANQPDRENLDFGRSLSPIPDLDGDGVEDVVVGAVAPEPEGDQDRPLPGRVYLLSGRTGALIRALGPDGLAVVARDDVRPLLRAMGEESERDLAARDAGSMRLPDVDPLVLIVREGDAAQAVRAVRLLRYLGRHAGPAVQTVRERIHRLAGSRRSAAVDATQDALIGECAALLASPALRAWLPDEALAETLGAMPTVDTVALLAGELRDRGAPVGTVLPSCLRFLEDPDGRARQVAFDLLARFAAPEVATGDDVRSRAVVACLSDANLDARLAAARLLKSWRVGAVRGLGPTLELLRMPGSGPATGASRWRTAEFEIAALLASGLSGDFDPVLGALVELSRQEDPVLRARAALILGHVRVEEWRHVEAVMGRLEEMRSADPEAMVKEAAAEGMAALEDRAETR